MGLSREEMLVIALSGVVRGLAQTPVAKDFLRKHRSWAAVVTWPTRQIDRLGDWMYHKMPWLPLWPQK